MDNIQTQSVTGFLCWMIVSFVSGLAVFARAIDDTVSERIGLAAVSICALSTAWRGLAYGAEYPGGTGLAVALAFYALAVFFKHWRRHVRRRKVAIPS